MGKKSREKQERKEDDGQIIKKEESQNTGLSSFLWWVIFIGTGLITFTPFIISGDYFFPFVGPKSIYFFALVEIIFAAWLILIYVSPKYRPRLNVLTMAIILFLVSAILSSFLGADLSRSFWSKYERMTGVLMLFHLFAFFLVTSSTFRKKEDWLKIFGISVFASICMGLLALALNHGMNPLGNMSSATRGGATLGNSSFLGTYLLFNLFIALYLVLNSKNLFKILSILGLVIIAASLFYSTARASLLSTAGGLVLLLLFWLLLNGKISLRLTGIFLIVVLSVGLVFSVNMVSKPGNFVNKIFTDNVGTTFGGRLIVWEGAWKGFLERPIFGWGPENFDIVFTRYFNPCMLGPDCGGDIWYDRAHNIVFDTIVTTGTVGMLSYLGLFLASFYALWKKFSEKNIHLLTAGIFSVVLIAYFMQNLTVFDMVNSYMMFFLVLGFIGSVFVREETNLYEKKPNHLITGVVLISFVLMFLNFVIQPAKADRGIIVSLGFQPASQGRIDSCTKVLETSQLGKYQIMDFFAQSDLDFFQSESAQSLPKNQIKDNLDFDSQKLEEYIKDSPLDYRLHLRLGQIYNAYVLTEDGSKFPRAEEVLNRAIELSPTNQQGYWALAQTQVYEGKLNEALIVSEKALSLEPKSRQGNLIVIQIAKIMGDNDLMLQKILEAIKNDPSIEADINSIFGL